MKFIKFLVLLSTLVLAGCGATKMTPSVSQDINKPSDGNAKVVFMRDSFIGSAISASLSDVTNPDNVKFIGIMNNGTRVAYEVSPGKHRFMVTSEAADFLEADLVAGKTYYAVVTPRMGVWAARFSLWPVSDRADSKFNHLNGDGLKMKSETTLVEISEAASNWWLASKAKALAKMKKHIVTWQQKTKDDLEKRTLKPEDGR